MKQMMAASCLLLLLLSSGGVIANQGDKPVGDVKALHEQGVLTQSAVPSSKSSLDVSTKKETVAELQQQLTQTKLSKTVKILEQLEATQDTSVRRLFQTLLDGALYYQRDNLRLLAIDKQGDGTLQASDLISGAEFGTVSKKSIKKIRVNNRLRIYLRGALSRLALTDENIEVREAAVLSMLDRLKPDNVDALKMAASVETAEEVQSLLQLALAMNTLSQSPLQAERLAAIDTMAGRLESSVRNQLQALVDDGNEEDAQVQDAALKALKNIDGKVTAFGYLEQLFFGLSLGSVLLLAAIGLAITFGVMGVINMAHGEMIMIGAYATFVVQQLMPNFLEYSIWVAIPAAFLTAGLVGVLIERCVIRYLHGRPLETLLATFGISLILQQAVRTIFSPLNQTVVTPDWMSGSLELNAVLSVTYSRIYIFIFALIVFAALQIVMKKTSLGLQVRAVSQNRNMAKSMGIRTDRVDALTFGLGSGIAGIAGVALSQITNVGPNLGQAYIIDSFMVVVFGGVGNLLGTLFAGFSLGIANKFLEPATGAVLANIIVLVFIILFMQKKPKGLFPQKGRAAE